VRLIDLHDVPGFLFPVFREGFVEIDIEFTSRIVRNFEQLDRLAVSGPSAIVASAARASDRTSRRTGKHPR